MVTSIKRPAHAFPGLMPTTGAIDTRFCILPALVVTMLPHWSFETAVWSQQGPWYWAASQHGSGDVWRLMLEQ